MVSLYKDPDGDKVFEAHDRALIAETFSQYEVSSTSAGALQQRIRQLEDELCSNNVGPLSYTVM